MTAASAATANRANSITDVSVGNYRRSRRLNEAVMQKSRVCFPVKTAYYLSDATGYSVRAAERWLAGSAVIPSDALAALLQSNHGREFLAAVMTDTTPKWWMQLKAFFQAVDLATAQRIHRRKMKALLDDEYASQVPASLFVQDEDFAAGQPSPARPMAPARKR